MFNIIKADFYRMIRNYGMYIALLIMIIMIAASVYLVMPGNVGMTVDIPQVSNVVSSAEDMEEVTISSLRETMLNSNGYALDKSILGKNINLYYIFIFFAVIIITSDFSSSSIKNTLSSAISREKYFISKFVFLTVCCLAVLFLNTYITYFSNLIFNGEKFSSSLWETTKITLLQIPPVIALASILNGMSFILRKTSLFNTVSIPFIMVFQMIISFIKAAGIQEIFPKYDLPTKYELSMIFYNLSETCSDNYIVGSYVVCGIIAVLFSAVGYFSFKKAEIK